jgi:hypothetical protein
VSNTCRSCLVRTVASSSLCDVPKLIDTRRSRTRLESTAKRQTIRTRLDPSLSRLPHLEQVDERAPIISKPFFQSLPYPKSKRDTSSAKPVCGDHSPADCDSPSSRRRRRLRSPLSFAVDALGAFCQSFVFISLVRLASTLSLLYQLSMVSVKIVRLSSFMSALHVFRRYSNSKVSEFLPLFVSNLCSNRPLVASRQKTSVQNEF